jgi:hypothetical protein
MYTDNNIAKTIYMIDMLKEAIAKYGVEELKNARKAPDFNLSYDTLPELEILIKTL